MPGGRREHRLMSRVDNRREGSLALFLGQNERRQGWRMDERVVVLYSGVRKTGA